MVRGLVVKTVRFAAGLALLAALLMPGTAAAQDLIVLVVNEQNQPLAGAVGQLGDQQATTGASGMLRFTGLAAGTHTLAIRFVGYRPVVRSVEVGAGAPTRELVKMEPAPYALPPVIVDATRPGLYGTVTDDRLAPLPGARVELLGTRGRAVLADSGGGFAFPLAAGPNLLRITHPGFLERRFSITIPDEGGQEVLVHLAADRGFARTPGNGELNALRDLRSRLAWGNRRDVMTREEMARFGTISVCDTPILNSVTRDRRGSTLGVVDGWEVTWNVCAFQADEVELVEWGDNVCRDPTGMLVRMFQASCRGMRDAQGIGPRPSATLRELPGYIIIWRRW